MSDRILIKDTGMESYESQKTYFSTAMLSRWMTSS
jgi:hypothetical protein